MINDAVDHVEGLFDASFNELSGRLEAHLDASLRSQDRTIDAIQTQTTTSLIELRRHVDFQDASLKDLIDASYIELKDMIEDGQAASDTSIREYIDSENLAQDQKEQADKAEVDASIIRIEAKFDMDVQRLDEKIEDVSARLDQKIDDKTNEVSAGLSQALDEAYTDLKTRIDAIDASQTQDISVIKQLIREETEGLATEIVNTKNELTNYIDSSVNTLREDTSADLAAAVLGLERLIEETSTGVAERAQRANDELEQALLDNTVAVVGDMESSILGVINAVDEELRDEMFTAVNTLRRDTSIEIGVVRNTLELHIDASYAVLSDKVDNISGDIEDNVRRTLNASISELKIYTDNQNAILEGQITRDYIEADASVVDALERSMRQAVIETADDYNGKIYALQNTLTQETDRLDRKVAETSAWAQSKNDELYVALDASILETKNDILSLEAATDRAIDAATGNLENEIELLRQESRNADASLYEKIENLSPASDASLRALKAELIEYSDAQDASLKRVIGAETDAKIAALDVSCQNEFDETLQLIYQTKRDLHNEILDASSDAANQRLLLGQRIDQLSAEFDNFDASASNAIALISQKVDTNTSTLRNEIQAGDNALSQEIAELRAESRAADASLNDKIDSISYVSDASLREVKEYLISYSDTNDASLAAAIENLASKEATDVTAIYNRIDASFSEAENDIELLRQESRDADASLWEKIETLSPASDASLRELKAELIAYSDAQDASLRNVIETETDDKLTALNSSVAGRITETEELIYQTKGELVQDIMDASDYADDQRQLLAQRIGAVESTMTTLDVSVQNAIDTLSEQHDRDVSAINAHIDASIVELRNYAELGFQTEDEKIQQIQSDVNSALERIDEYSEEIAAIDAKVDAANEKVDIVSQHVDEVTEGLDARFDAVYEEIENASAYLAGKIDDISTSIDDEIAGINTQISNLHADDSSLENYIDDVSTFAHQINASTSTAVDMLITTVETMEETHRTDVDAIYTKIARNEQKVLDLSTDIYNTFDEIEETDARQDTSIEQAFNYVDESIREFAQDVSGYVSDVVTDAVGEAIIALEEQIAEDISSAIEPVYVRLDDFESDVDDKFNELKDYVDVQDSSLSDKIDALAAYTDIRIDEVAQDVSIASEEIEEVKDFTLESVNQIDASVRQIFDMVSAIYRRLGLDHVEEPQTDIIPAILKAIDDISTNVNEDWRYLDTSPGPDEPTYEEYWRELDEDAEIDTDDSDNYSVIDHEDLDEEEADQLWRIF